MSSGNAHQDRLHEELDNAIHESAPSDKLEDVEIQRLVQLSNDASYQRSERVPVKTVEAFEPRSLVSIAMTAQRRRESELRKALAAGVVIDEAATDPAEAGADPNGEAGEDEAQPVVRDRRVGEQQPGGLPAGRARGHERLHGEARQLQPPQKRPRHDFAQGARQGRRATQGEEDLIGMTTTPLCKYPQSLSLSPSTVGASLPSTH